KRDKEAFPSFDDMKDDLKSDILNEKLEDDPTIAQNKMYELLKDADIDIKIEGMEDLFDFVDEPIEDPNQSKYGEGNDEGDVDNEDNSNNDEHNDQNEENEDQNDNDPENNENNTNE